MNKNIFYNSLIVSIVIQVLIAVIDFIALLVKVPIEYNIIKQILLLEFIVQVIEGTFYIWLFYNGKNNEKFACERMEKRETRVSSKNDDA